MKKRLEASDFLKYHKKQDPSSGTHERVFDVNFRHVNDETLNRVIGVLAKRGNQRLRELEKPTKKGTTGATNMRAYKTVEQRWKDGNMYMDTTSKGKVKFSTNPTKLTRAQKIAEIKDLQRWLTSKESTKKGIKEKYQKMADTYNRKYGTNLSADQIGEIFNTLIAKNKTSVISSEQVVDIISRTNIDTLDPDDQEKVLDKIANSDSLSVEGMIRSANNFIRSDEAGDYFRDKYGSDFKFKKR